MEEVDLIGLRTAIETALSDELGIYVFPNGQTTPAIVLSMGTDTSPIVGTKAEGLECVLVFRPDVPLRPLMGNAFEETYTVQILLKQWSAEQNTLGALSKILETMITLPGWSLQGGSVRRQIPIVELGNIEILSMVLTQTLLREA